MKFQRAFLCAAVCAALATLAACKPQGSAGSVGSADKAAAERAAAIANENADQFIARINKEMHDDYREVTAAQVSAAVRRANEVVWDARGVSVRTVSRAEAEALGVAVPEHAGDEVRLVDAEGFDLQPCGGTHVRNTAEIGPIQVIRIRSEGKRNKRIAVALAGGSTAP